MSMEENDGIPMTSQITAFQFMDLYYEYYQKGCTELVLILINGKGSATYNNSLMAVDMLGDFFSTIKSVFQF